MQNIGQNKTQLLTNNVKLENNEFKTARIKNRTCYSFDDMIKLEDFDIDNILIDKQLDELFWCMITFDITPGFQN